MCAVFTHSIVSKVALNDSSCKQLFESRMFISSGIPLVSIDIPSGWDVEKGDIHGIGLAPDMLCP